MQISQRKTQLQDLPYKTSTTIEREDRLGKNPSCFLYIKKFIVLPRQYNALLLKRGTKVDKEANNFFSSFESSNIKQKPNTPTIVTIWPTVAMLCQPIYIAGKSCNLLGKPEKLTQNKGKNVNHWPAVYIII